jgi:bacterioferritin
MANPELLDGLNDQLNREVTTFLRYMLQAASIKGAQWQNVREMYQAEVTDEVGHVQYLADQISMLGGARHPRRTDGCQELHAAGRPGRGLFALKMQMEEQTADEDDHRQAMQRLLG